MGWSQRGRTISWPSLRPMEPTQVGGSQEEGWEEADPSPESLVALLVQGGRCPLPFAKESTTAPWTVSMVWVKCLLPQADGAPKKDDLCPPHAVMKQE
jgi:hypothetical protein